MKRILFILAVVAMLTLVFSSSAFAQSTSQTSHHIKPFINEVPCNNSQFLDIGSSVQGPTCFANTGYIGFRIDGATSIHAGNNNGWVKCYGGSACGSGKFYYFYEYYTYQLGGATITQVDITSSN